MFNSSRLTLKLFLITVLFLASSKPASSRKIGYFWHLSDFHLDINYTAFSYLSNECRVISTSSEIKVSDHSLAGQYGEYVCYTPIALVRSIIRAMLEKGGTTPDFVLWTGDNCGPVEHGQCSVKDIIKATRNLREEFANIVKFGGTMGYPVLGLRDAAVIYSNYPRFQTNESGLEGIYNKLGAVFYHWMEDQMRITFSKGGFYSHIYRPHLQIMVLNTFLFTEAIPYENDPLGQWTWIEEQLKEARLMKRKVYLVYSVPPGIYEKVYHPPGVHWFHFKHNRHFLLLIRNFSDVIAGQFAGQYHSDVFRIVYNNAEPISWILLSPSVSPNFKDLPPFVASNHPAIRLYKYDTITAQVLDYTQFYLDLNLANNRSHDEWEYGYSFTTYYSLPNLSAQSLQLLLTRLENDESFLDRYFHASNSMFPRKRNIMATRYPKEGQDLKHFRYRHLQDLKGCGPMCKRYHICSAVHLEYDRFLECILAAGAKSIKWNKIWMIQYLILILTLTTVAS